MLRKQNGIALCTCWTDPAKIDTSEYQMAGTLYSPSGIPYLIQTLGKTPSIKQVIISPDDPLSRTPIGRKGWESLLILWKKGLAKNHIPGTDIVLPKEITAEMIDYLRKHVHISLQKSPVTPKDRKAINISFTPPKKETYPSEKHGFLIRAQTIEQAHQEIVNKIMRYGTEKETEYKTKQKELLAVTWVIEEPTTHDSKEIEAYTSQLLDPHCPPGISYTYGQRLRNFKGTDQVQQIIDKLKESPISRRAAATTHDPSKDNSSNSPPCLGYLHFLCDEKLHLTAFFRSHDMMKGAKANAYALTGLMKHIADAIKKETGTLTIVSNSAHIYEHDYEEARHIRPPITRTYDPRGNVIIQVRDRIHLTLQSLEGTTIRALKGCAEELIEKIAQEDLLSQKSHYLYIGKELQKAQLALEQNIPYVQDNHLNLQMNMQ
ncbi:MAG: thymidylate synthase [Candidatus Woesearchaeota archaeon]